MRRRELLRKLTEIKSRSWPLPIFAGRKEARSVVQQDHERLYELEKLLPEIIEKLKGATP